MLWLFSAIGIFCCGDESYTHVGVGKEKLCWCMISLVLTRNHQIST